MAVSATASWVLGANGTPTVSQVNDIYAGPGSTVNGGFILGTGSTMSNTGLTFDLSLGVPGASWTGSYGWLLNKP